MTRANPLNLFISKCGALRRKGAALGLALASLPCHAAGTGALLPSLSSLGFLGLGSLALILACYRGFLKQKRGLEHRVEQLETTNRRLCAELAKLRAEETQARINAERFRNLTSLSSDWYWEQDADLRFTMRTTWMLGDDPLPQSGFLGRCRWELDGIVATQDWSEHRKTLEQRQPFRGFEYQFRSGQLLRWVSINGEPVYDESGAFIGYRGTGRDITRRKNAEAALRASEERFNEIIGSMPVGLFIKDPDSRITLMNRECERQWGVPFAQIGGTDASQVLRPDESASYLRSDLDAFRLRRIIEFEGAIRNIASGESVLVKALKKPVFDEAGNPRYLIGITVDITAQKHAEEQLRQSRESLRQLARHQTRLKEEERKRIARDIHDDLGQNLMALRLEVETIVGGAVEPGAGLERRARVMMETVDQTIRSVRHIINDLRPAVLDLGLVAALEWQVQEFARRSGLPCTLAVELDGQELSLDDTHATTLFRVLQESLTNVMRHAAAKAVNVRLHRNSDFLFLYVCDDGMGGVSIDGRRSKQAFGLLGMGERLRMLGGTLDIGDQPTGGTRLVAGVPLRAAAPSSS